MALQQVMGELQQLGALDPAAQARLMADLKQTDPAWWPMVVQQFRAAVAYRRGSKGSQQGDSGSGSRWPVRTVSGTMLPDTPPPPETAPGGWGGQQAATQPDRPPGGDPLAGQLSEPMERLPAAEDAALAPPTAPRGSYPVTAHPDTSPRMATATADVRQMQKFTGEAREASDAAATAEVWQTHLDEAIRALESQLTGAPETPDGVARHARLHMLYLLAGRRDDAVKPIPSIPPSDQEFWSKELYGLATWLDTQGPVDAANRAAATKQILEEAVTRLKESAPLVVRNLAFCTEVQSYGCTKPFKTQEFVPDQEVLLYAEVENFVSKPTPKGLHTSLRSSYQIFDSRGQRVAEHEFTTTEEYCQNARRDFFIGYHLRLPKRIYPGKHTLQLTIEDVTSHKVGQSSIELTIKDADK